MSTDPYDGDLDAVWRALANPVRRAILDELKRAPRPTGDLADSFDELSRFAIMQHLGVLEEADLVVRRRTGRVTMNYFNPVPIQRIADRWIDRMRRPWVESLVELKAELEQGGDEGDDQNEARADHAG